MMNIELFRHHNNHEDEAGIILTGSSGSVLPPVALWVAQSYRLTPGQGGLHCSRGGVLNIKVFHMGGGVECGPPVRGLLKTRGPLREGFLQKTQQCS